MSNLMSKDEFARRASALGFYACLRLEGIVEGNLTGATPENLEDTYAIWVKPVYDGFLKEFAKSLGLSLEILKEFNEYERSCRFRLTTAEHLAPEYDPEVDDDLKEALSDALRNLQDAADAAYCGFVALDEIVPRFNEYLKRLTAFRTYRAKFNRSAEKLYRCS